MCWTVNNTSADFQMESLACYQVAQCKCISNDQDDSIANLYLEHILEAQQAKAHQENPNVKQNIIKTIGRHYLWRSVDKDQNKEIGHYMQMDPCMVINIYVWLMTEKMKQC